MAVQSLGLSISLMAEAKHFSEKDGYHWVKRILYGKKMQKYNQDFRMF